MRCGSNMACTSVYRSLLNNYGPNIRHSDVTCICTLGHNIGHHLSLPVQVLVLQKI